MILFGDEVKKKLMEGINLVADTVKPTLGPQAKTVILQGNPPVVINDGVTITKYVNNDDPFIQMGIQLVQDIASKAQDTSGDGTTTACVLAQALCNNILELEELYNLHQLKLELLTASMKVTRFLKEKATEIDEDNVYDIAMIASNNDADMASIISEAVKTVGKEGIVALEESKSNKTYLEVKEGIELDEGYLSHLMANTENGETVFENPLIFMSNLSIRNFQDILPVLEISSAQSRPLLIMCKGMEGSALNNLIANVMANTIQCAAILAPNFGDAQIDELGDICSLVGGKVLTAESKDDPQLVSLTELGSCSKVMVSKEKTILIGGEGNTDGKIAQLRGTIEEAKGMDRARLKRRLARLAGGVAVIHVGAGSTVELRETKERLDDALNATKSALKGGIIIGGGKSLYNARKALDLEVTGDYLVYKSLTAPFMTLVNNAGLDLERYTVSVDDEYDMGIDMVSGNEVNLREAGIFDPLLVTLGSFDAAMSIANLFLTTDVAVLSGE
jgi:chaperonin GroEL